MDSIKIDTTQNIDIEQPVASIGERIAATMLDMLILFGYFLVLISIYGLVHSKALLVVLSIPISIYSLVSELVMNGQSWGKKVLKIKVIKIDGTPTSFSSYFLRWILRLVEILVMFGSLATITILLNRKGQRLGDIAANTAVIRLRNKSLSETIYEQIPDDYQLVYPEVARLTVSDIYTIKEVLELLKSPGNNSNVLSIAKKAHEAIERKLNIKAGQKTKIFFHTIISDYNFIHSRV